MKILLIRKYKKADYTIGNLLVDGKFICNTLEDTDRGLTQNMSIEEIQEKKIKNKTAIPLGTYTVTLDIVSPKYKKYKFYFDNANMGRVPRLLDVIGYDGVLIHVGNYPSDTSGCILVGLNKIKGQLVDSRTTFIKLYNMMLKAKNRGEKITIQIMS